MDTLALLNEFVLKVVHHRQTARLQAWSNSIREDLTSHPYQWLRPEFVPPAPYLVCNPQDSPNRSEILVQRPFIDAHFRKAWMPYFVGKGTPLSPLRPSLTLLVIIFLKRPFWINPSLLVRSFMKLLGLALVLRQIDAAGRWLQGLLDAKIAIPKADGDSTPLGQRSVCVLPVVYRLWASVRLAHLQDWFYSWVPDSVFSARKGGIFGGCLVYHID